MASGSTTDTSFVAFQSSSLCSKHAFVLLQYILQPSQPVCRVDEEGEEDDLVILNFEPECDGMLPLLKVKMKVADWLISVEVDTGASKSLIAETTFQNCGQGGASSQHLCTYLLKANQYL